jgi:hypothetical protein
MQMFVAVLYRSEYSYCASIFLFLHMEFSAVHAGILVHALTRRGLDGSIIVYETLAGPYPQQLSPTVVATKPKITMICTHYPKFQTVNRALQSDLNLTLNLRLYYLSSIHLPL